MTEEEINTILLLLECTLINSESPSYIEVSFQLDSIYILLSKPEYKHYKLHERIQGVYSLLLFEHSDILDQVPVIIECLDDNELYELFRMYNYKEEE